MSIRRSASLGNCRPDSGLAAGCSGLIVPGNGKLRAIISFFSAALSVCRRVISASSALRSSGTIWHAHPELPRLQSETWPVRPSSRK